jgi:hypothetical protein
VHTLVRGHHDRRRELRWLRLEHRHERLRARIVLRGRELPDLHGSRLLDLSLPALRRDWNVLRVPGGQLGLHDGRLPRGVNPASALVGHGEFHRKFVSRQVGLVQQASDVVEHLLAGRRIDARHVIATRQYDQFGTMSAIVGRKFLRVGQWLIGVVLAA